jgi:hypothetical protein
MIDRTWGLEKKSSGAESPEICYGPDLVNFSGNGDRMGMSDVNGLFALRAYGDPWG